MDIQLARLVGRRWAVMVGVLLTVMAGSPAGAAEESYALGYTRANNPTASSYTPTAAYSYNASGARLPSPAAAPAAMRSDSEASGATARRADTSR
jgi:hypothetical protein